MRSSDHEEIVVEEKQVRFGFFPGLRIFYGLLFIASAILKLFPVDYFELILVDQVGISWYWVPYFSRGLILLEFAVGAFLVSGFKLKETIWFSILLVLVFQLFLAIQILSGEAQADCGCFGELIPLNGVESFFKNLGIHLIGLVLLLKLVRSSIFSLRWFGPLAAVVMIPIVFFTNPVPEVDADADFELDIELLSLADFKGSEALEEGDKTVVMLLANCVHCAQLSSFIATLDPDDIRDDLRIIVVGREAGYSFFVNETGISEFDVVRSRDRELVGAIDGTFPTILKLENGRVTKKWKGRQANIRLLADLLGDD